MVSRALSQHLGQGRAAPMQTALLILPNFVIILVGLVLARRFDFGRDFWDGLEKLVYYVLFPALLFRALAIARIDFSTAGTLIAAALAFTLAGFALSLAAGPLFGLGRKLLATGSQCGYRFNTYVGLAVAGSVFGTPGVALAALLLGVMIPLANVLAVAMLAAHGSRGFLHELATHPLVVSSLAGLAWNVAVARGEALRGSRHRVGSRGSAGIHWHRGEDPLAVRGPADGDQCLYPRGPHGGRWTRRRHASHGRHGAFDGDDSRVARAAACDMTRDMQLRNPSRGRNRSREE